jgi:hypothetical protein
MIRRVSVTKAEAAQVVPPDGEHHVGRYTVTILNTGEETVELVDASTKSVGEGFPLVGGAAWSSELSSEEIWAVTDAGSAVSLAVSMTAVE